MELSQNVTYGQNITSKNPTNLKQHLSSSHPEAHREEIEIEVATKKAKNEVEAKRCSIFHKAGDITSKQLTMSQSLSAGKQYKKDSPHYQEIARRYKCLEIDASGY